jgi:hypothetical protein
VRVSEQWRPGDTVFMRLHTDPDADTAGDLHRVPGTVRQSARIVLRDGTIVDGRIRTDADTVLDLDVVEPGGTVRARCSPTTSSGSTAGSSWWSGARSRPSGPPAADDAGVYVDYVGAYLTGTPSIACSRVSAAGS